MPHVLAAFILALGLVAPAHAAPATPDREIAALIEAIGRSGCRFERNGSWHAAARAREHVQRKYDWLHKRGMAGTAEQFIERAASRSSLTGREYHVQCPGQARLTANAWFRAALHRLRAPAPTR